MYTSTSTSTYSFSSSNTKIDAHTHEKRSHTISFEYKRNITLDNTLSVIVYIKAPYYIKKYTRTATFLD